MRNILKLLFISLTVLSSFTALKAQKTTTIIVLRHAEKESSGGQMMQSDPALSKEGRTRAENLVLALSEFPPDAVYSTNYVRTRSTVEPLAKKYNLDIQTYDPRNQQSFAEQLKTSTGKTFVVVGHSNTAPRLVNLIIGAENKYDDLDESVYDHLYIIRITDGIPTVEIRKY